MASELAGEHTGGIVLIAVAVVEHKGRFLIGLRPAGAPLAGYWEFPGGKRHVGEPAESAAVRECLEETGLAVQAVGQYPDVTHGERHSRLAITFFRCRVVRKLKELPDRFRWVPRHDLGAYRFPPANAELLKLLLGTDSGVACGLPRERA